MVFLGGAMAVPPGGGPRDLFAACLAVALVLQIAANLVNDYFDARSGTDAADRLGPVRGILSLKRRQNPAFGWQDTRWHLSGAVTVFEGLYAGVTRSTDFDEFHQTSVELRTEMPLGATRSPT